MASRQARRLTAGLMVVGLGVVGLSMMSLQENSVYFYTPPEAVAQWRDFAQTGRKVKLGGLVQLGSLRREGTAVRFILGDGIEAEIPVSYVGSLPDMFKEGAGAVVDGVFSSDQKVRFIADRVMVKHSEEYRVPGVAPSQDAQLLRRSILDER